MNNNEIDAAKKEYSKLQALKEKYKDLKQRINYLENHNIVREYLQLVKQLNMMDENFNYDDENLVSLAFEGIADKTENSNEIWVYMGSYKTDPIMYNTMLVDKFELSDYILEKNLETCEERKIYISEIIKRCISKSQMVERPKSKPHKRCRMKGNFNSYNDYLKAFEKLRISFLKELINYPQEEVIKSMINEKIKYRIH